MSDQYGILTKDIIKLINNYPDNYDFMNKVNSLVLKTAKNLNCFNLYVSLSQLGKLTSNVKMTEERLQFYESILSRISDPNKNEYLWFRGELNRLYIKTSNYEHTMDRSLELKKDA